MAERIVTDLTNESFDVFRMFDRQWAQAAAGTAADCNTMTIGWGTLGSIWGPPAKGKQIVTVFLRENRYTLEYIRKNDLFTVSFFPEQYRKAMGILGSVSGRDDPAKIQRSGLTPVDLCGSVSFAEANQVFVCRKLFVQRMESENIIPAIREKMYGTQEEHVMVIGEIDKYIDRRD